MIRTLLVDDEDIARERLRQMLGSINDVEVVGEAADGEEAIQKTLETAARPAASRYPNAGHRRPRGGRVPASAASQDRLCTAFDTYAVKAFDLHAIDYLLKPASLHRLAQAIERIRQRPPRDADADVDRLTRVVPGASAPPAGPLRRTLQGDPAARRPLFLLRNRAYQTAHPGACLCPRTHSRRSRGAPGCALFFRLSRAVVVKLDSITEVRPLIGGTAEVVLNNGATLEVSRRRVKELLERLDGGFNSPAPPPGPPPA